MADIWTQRKRSEVMSLIRGKGNKETEQALLSLLKRNKITGWRRHLPLLGKPDFAFPKQKVAVFVDGCFWHGCPRCYTRPKTNRAFWDRKREENMARDRRVTRQLRLQGWKVIRIWQHSLKRSPDASLNRIRRTLERGNTWCSCKEASGEPTMQISVDRHGKKTEQAALAQKGSG